jgi:uroporphyrinogen decarboxylase
MLTSKQRVLSAVAHKISDRTPITFDAEKEVYDSLQQHLGARSKEQLFDQLSCDTWMVLPGNFIYPASEQSKAVKTTIWGFQNTVTAYSGGTYDELTWSPLAGRDRLSDIDEHPWPADDALDFSCCREDAEEHASRAVIGVFTWGVYFIASFVRGMQDLMTDFALNPAYVERLFATIEQRVLFFLERMLDAFGDSLDIVYMADDYCSQRGPLFSPETFSRFVVPCLAEIADRVHKRNKKFLLHVCGSVRPLLGMIIDAGVDMLEPVQTRAAGMEPAALKRDFGKDICFYGGLDLQEVLCKGTPRRVRDEVKTLIDVLGEGGGYVLGPGHTYIQPDAPIENIMAMYETAANYRPWSS